MKKELSLFKIIECPKNGPILFGSVFAVIWLITNTWMCILAVITIFSAALILDLNNWAPTLKEWDFWKRKKYTKTIKSKKQPWATKQH